jgi:ubiquinone biosynthesis protein UbiJ
MAESSDHVTYSMLWGVITAALAFSIATMLTAFDWHAAQPHANSVNRQVFTSEVGHLRSDMKRIEKKLDKLLEGVK